MQKIHPYPRQHLVALLAVSIVIHLFLFSFFGIREEFVDSQRYIEMADHLVAEGRLEHFYQIFYAIPVLLLAACRVLFSDGLVAFTFFQSVLSTAAALSLYSSASKAFEDERAGCFAAVIFLLWLDCIQWNTAIMTESLASSLICFTIHRLVIFKGSAKEFLVLALILILNLMTRPTGVLSIVGVTLFFLSYYRIKLQRMPAMKVCLFTCLILMFLSAAYLMLNEWDFTDQYVKGNVVTYMDVIEGQPHYHRSLRLDVHTIAMPDPAAPPVEKMIFFIIKNPLHFAKAALLKVFYLVSFYRPYFSTLHNLYTLMWLSMIYLFVYFGYGLAARKPVRTYCVAVVAGNCLLVALAAADWDNRFYLPMQPGIVLLAAGGGCYLLKRISLSRP